MGKKKLIASCRFSGVIQSTFENFVHKMRKPQYLHNSHAFILPLETKEMNFGYGGNLLLPQGRVAHRRRLRLREHQEALLHIVKGLRIHFVLHLLGIEHAIIWKRRESNLTNLMLCQSYGV